MNEMDFAKLTSEVEVVINNAASIDFDSRVDINMRINAKGAMNILNFSKACKKYAHYDMYLLLMLQVINRKI